MIRKAPVVDPHRLTQDGIAEAILQGPRPSQERLKRRLVLTQVALAGASIVASILLYSITGLGHRLEQAGPLMRDVYALVGILVPAGHAGLAFVLVSGVPNGGRYAARGTWLMILVHLAWGGGIAVGHLAALPIGAALVVGDVLFLTWLRGARESLDAGKPAPATLR